MLTTGRTLYSHLLHKVCLGLGKFSSAKAELQVLNRKISQFKKIVVETFVDHCSNVLFPLKFHFFDHIVEDLCNIGKLSALYAALFEFYNVPIYTSYRRASRRMKSRMERSLRFSCFAANRTRCHGHLHRQSTAHPWGRLGMHTVVCSLSNVILYGMVMNLCYEIFKLIPMGFV